MPCGFHEPAQDVFLAGSVIFEVLTGQDTPFLPPKQQLRSAAGSAAGKGGGSGAAAAAGAKPDFLSGFSARPRGGGEDAAAASATAAEPLARQARRRAIRDAVASGAAPNPAALELLSAALPPREAIEARHLVSWMCASQSAARPSIEDVLAHPLFWSLEARTVL